MASAFLSKKLLSSVVFLLVLLLVCHTSTIGDCRKLKVGAEVGTEKGEENGKEMVKFSQKRLKLEEMSLPPLPQFPFAPLLPQFPFPPPFAIPKLPPLPPLPSIPTIPTFAPFPRLNLPPFPFSFSPPPQ
ncbi:hypothetical protein H6P81_019776 [Aristolochia fimbriata]|uniref:Uncharacterized protein n=1 Tax=Aristolochia fimbriata TaxID=158543 RepID=A0AAV7DTX3_ARIFI|nr:hypothetical protein H6P81_019776 [Aristolochia fimbriata]